MPDQDVKRCPFCGGAAAVSINHSVTKNAYYTRVKCLGCGGQGRTFKSGENPENDSASERIIQNAIEAWNMRTPEDHA